MFVTHMVNSIIYCSFASSYVTSVMIVFLFAIFMLTLLGDNKIVSLVIKYNSTENSRDEFWKSNEQICSFLLVKNRIKFNDFLDTLCFSPMFICIYQNFCVCSELKGNINQISNLLLIE
jgi:type IV secretory pathway VirB3-like protein